MSPISNDMAQNGGITLPAYVLDDCKPQDVGSSMIEHGCQKQPFYIFDIDEAYYRIQYFRNSMPRIQVFYAMQANDTEMMLKLGMACSLNFSCSSPFEVYKLRYHNISPESILYTIPSKMADHMKYARDSKIKYTTFDSSEELRKLKEYWPDSRLLLRIRVGSEKEINLEEKFGCDFESEAVDLLEEAASLGLKVIGVAFHVGSKCTAVNRYLVGLTYARALFDHEANVGRTMTVVNIGGGFCGVKTNAIDQVSKFINRKIEDIFPDPKVKIIAEPGRYFCESAFTLYCSINSVRKSTRNDKTVNMIYLNDGIYGTMRFVEHKPTKFKRANDDESGNQEVILWGPSCDSYDRVMKDVVLQLPNITPSDWLVFNNHGAYTITYETRFSSLLTPLIRPVVTMDTMHKLKNTNIFSSRDFIVHPDSLALPITMPLLLKSEPTSKKARLHPQVPTLIV
ncbi:ornithine decarboxylase 2-like [Trichoplusia ni]|uniref:Ornithine decarboxylase 2-like n=1 Tax=Trichoplusia ni TaxID=7111 RepID=A0A7E5X467_TRINI|nr:ornithine decarboxylase 2-like [Trichoplusia ni]